MTKTGSRKIGILLAVLICLSAWLSVGAFASESPEAAYEVAEGEWVEGSLVEAAEKVMDGGEIKLLRNVELAVRNNEAWNMTGDREITLLGEGFSICLVGQAISVGDNVVLNLGAEGYTETLTIYSESDTNMIIGVDGRGNLEYVRQRHPRAIGGQRPAGLHESIGQSSFQYVRRHDNRLRK